MYLPVLMPHTPAALVRFALVGSLLIAGGCGWWKPLPTPILPPDQLYLKGESDLERNRYEDARKSLTSIVERHPDSSYAPRARFLVGETYYRDADFDKAIKEFEGFMAFYPRHQIADLVQYRLAMSYYDQLKPVEQDQGLMPPIRPVVEGVPVLVRQGELRDLFPHLRPLRKVFARGIARVRQWIGHHFLPALIPDHRITEADHGISSTIAQG